MRLLNSEDTDHTREKLEFRGTTAPEFSACTYIVSCTLYSSIVSLHLLNIDAMQETNGCGQRTLKLADLRTRHLEKKVY